VSQRSNTIKAAGLYTFLSELQAPEGSHVIADNVNIDELGVLSSRRGFNDYGSELPETPYRVKQVLDYKNRIIRYYNDTLEYDDGSGNFSAFSGQFNEVEDGFRIKAEEVNGNLYFTSSDGIKKISASSESQLANVDPIDAGAPKAIDLSAKTLPLSSGFLPPQSKVAYKVLFGYKDNNNVLVLGAPTSRFVVSNNSSNVTIPEQSTIQFLKTETGSIYIGKYFTIDSLDQSFYVWYSESGTTTEEPQDEGTLGKVGIEVKIGGTDDAQTVAENTANVLFNELVDQFSVSITNTDTVRFVSKEEGNLNNITAGSITEPADIITDTIQEGDVSEGTSANCEISTIIPDGVTTDYFVQVYRTSVITVSQGLDINDIDPGEDCNLVFEQPVTQSARSTITITDQTPNSFRDTGTPLYNNPISGQGILQANNVPPIAKDIETFNNYTFYSNTKTFHRNQFTFVSVDDFGDEETSIVVGNEDVAREYVFQGEQEVTEIVCDTVANTLETNANDSYIIINSANNERKYYIWFDKGTGVNPFIDAATSIRVDLSADGIVAGDNVGQYLELALLEFGDFNITYDNVDTVTITNVNNGDTIDTSTPNSVLDSNGVLQTDNSSTDLEDTSGTGGGGSTWTITVNQQGRGEDSSTNRVLWSILPSVGQAIEETARSFVRIINKDVSSPVRATYLSGENDLPGLVLLENKDLEDKPFYIGIKNVGSIGSDIGAEFNPELPVINEDVTGIASAPLDSSVTRISTGTEHGLSIGDEIFIYAPDNNPSNDPIINNKFQVVNKVEDVGSGTFYFDIPFTITNSSSIDFLDAFFFAATQNSDNEERPNRIYYSKLQQPEAVPIVNFIDVGGKDEPIERILALRDTLFILKTDGVYTLTGFNAPFNVRLLDNTNNILAPDSAVVLNNQIFALMDDGVSVITESGSSVISRSLENKILEVTGTDVDFRLKTFGLAYENDKAYILWLPTTSEDDNATQCYRYNYYERTWTRWTVPATSARVSRKQNVLYIGDGTRPNLLKERKDRSRTDYADRNFTKQIPDNSILDKRIRLTSFIDVEIGDVLVQSQYVTIDIFNNLLAKLDLDGGVSSIDYEDTLKTKAGDSIADKLEELNLKLIADSISVTSYTWLSNLESIQTNYNALVGELNGASSGTDFKTYTETNQLTKYESIVDGKNEIRPDLNEIFVLVDPRFFEGDIEVYKAIKKVIQWNPLHFGDPSAQKQFSKGTIILDQNNFTKATVSYSSDVSQGFVDIEKNGKGVGYYSSGFYGDPDLYWGGNGNDVPLMNIIPREKQRGRYLNVKFQHGVAREGFRILGVTTVIRAVSDRAYR
jgi:hypothetical protein